MDKELFKFATRTIHGGQEYDPTTGAVIPPIYTSSTYAQVSPGVHKGYEYSRSQNPTRFAYEKCIANLEEGMAGFAFASGMAAMATILELLDSGSHIISMDDVYGGTYRLLELRNRTAGHEITYIDMTNMDNLKKAMTEETDMIWVETPSNPLLKLTDIELLTRTAKEINPNTIIVIDNTFASPYNQTPLKMGADIVMHSATKYINGHSDIVGGIVIIGNNKELIDRMRFLQNAIGNIAGPFDSYLALRGVKTLALRMRQHNENGFEIAKWLESHVKVKKVLYPGLPSHPQYKLAQKQMNGYGGIISFYLDTDLEGTKRFLEHLSIFALAESLGGVESLVEHPSIMTHSSVPKIRREMLGINDNLVRLSIGIENYNDLIADLKQALNNL